MTFVSRRNTESVHFGAQILYYHPHGHFNVDEGLVMAVGDNGRASHYTGQATTGKACPGRRGGSPRALLSGGLLLSCNDGFIGFRNLPQPEVGPRSTYFDCNSHC